MCLIFIFVQVSPCGTWIWEREGEKKSDQLGQLVAYLESIFGGRTRESHAPTYIIIGQENKRGIPTPYGGSSNELVIETFDYEG